MIALPDVPQSPSKLLCVGEALGSEEETTGHVFVGASGRLLNSMLRSAGLARESLYITNVFMSRPRNNEVDVFFLKKGEAKKTKTVSPYVPFGTHGILKPEFEPEVARLKAEILKANPTVIVALGATALWALTGETKISKMRGVVLPCILVPGKKVVGTYHPAAVLREYDSRPFVIADLAKAKEEAEFSEIRRVTRSIWLADKVSDLEVFERAHLTKAPGFATDVETAQAQITHVSIAPTPKACLVIPIWENGVSFWSEDDELVIRMWLFKILSDPKWDKVFQNALYDMTYWAEEGFYLRGRIHDTMLCSHSLQIELPKDLGTLGSLYCNEIAWKSFRTQSLKSITKKEA